MKKKINAICDFTVSRFCLKSHMIGEEHYLSNLRKNNGKYRCKLCAIEQTHKGDKSHYFKYSKNDTYFSLIDSEEKAYWLGALAGDGHITDKTISIIANITDIETINKFVKVIYVDSRPVFTKNENCFTISITSEQLAQDVLRHLNIKPGKKSDKITVPELSDNFKWAFIRGLFDTDGSVTNIKSKSKTPACYCSSTSIKILHQIQDFCTTKNINSCITGIKIKFSGRNAMQFMEKIYADSSVRLTRKYEMFKLWQTWAPRKKGRILSSEEILYIVKNKNCLSGKELAIKFDVSPSLISKIKHKEIIT